MQQLKPIKIVLCSVMEYSKTSFSFSNYTKELCFTSLFWTAQSCCANKQKYRSLHGRQRPVFPVSRRFQLQTTSSAGTARDLFITSFSFSNYTKELCFTSLFWTAQSCYANQQKCRSLHGRQRPVFPVSRRFHLQTTSSEGTARDLLF